MPDSDVFADRKRVARVCVQRRAVLHVAVLAYMDWFLSGELPTPAGEQEGAMIEWGAARRRKHQVEVRLQGHHIVASHCRSEPDARTLFHLDVADDRRIRRNPRTLHE
eukprot:186132-Rhodomonas_salina.3